jgi:chromosomal replication initiation ATPase DnaA
MQSTQLQCYGLVISPYVYVGLIDTINSSLDEGSIFSHISRTFSSAMGLTPRAILSRRRYRPLNICRQMIVALLRDYYHFHYTSIGHYMRRDHSTIINRYRCHGTDYETNGVYRRQYDNILKQIL